MPKHHEHAAGEHHKKSSAKSHHDLKNEADEAVIEEGLQAIYGDDRSDLHTVSRDGSRLTKMLVRLVLLLAVIAVLAFGGFFVYSRFFAQQTSSKPLVMSVEAPSEVNSGERIQIIVNYANPSRIPLASLELDINLPPTFVLSSAQPQPTSPEDLIWKIGSLGSHSDGQLVLEGLWLSGVPSTSSIQALAAYRPGNFNSNFSDIATASVATLSSSLDLEFKGPEQATPGEELTYTATVTNTGTQTMTGAELALTLPTGFILASSAPGLDPGSEPMWVLGDLIPQATAEVVWKGSFTAEVSDVQQFTAAVNLPNGDRKLPQTSETWFTDVIGSDLLATLVVNGNSDKATSELGGALRVTVRLENTGSSDIADASILMDFKPDNGVPIVWSSASLAGGKLTSAGIAFDSKTVGIIKPGEKKTFSLSFPVKTTLGSNEVDDWTVTAFVTTGDSKIQTPPFPISLKASPKLSAKARFYSESGAPIGTGPMPPEVNEATTYRVYWNLGQAVHELDQVVVSATLPPNVSWDDKVFASTGNVQFDEATQTVRWQIANLPANEDAQAEFTLKLVPGEEDLDTFVKLLSGSILSATDVETNGSVEATAEAFTTEIPDDTFAAGKGTVIE